MLEPILEETSEDEERARSSLIVSLDRRSTLWSSTESETGSVLRIETIKGKLIERWFCHSEQSTILAL